MPLLFFYAIFRAIFARGVREAEAVCFPHLQDVEEEVESKREEMFGHRSPLWVARTFEHRYKLYLEGSVRSVKNLVEHQRIAA